MWVLTVILLLNACVAINTGDAEVADQQTKERLSKINEETSYNVGQLSAQLILAIEIEVTAAGIRPLESQVIRAPMKTNSALADLHLKAFSGQAIISEYTFPDPRLVEVNSSGLRTLPKATTFIFVPLNRQLTLIRIDPVRSREKFVSRGGMFDPQPLMNQACENKQMYKECRDIWRLKAE